MRSPFVSCTHVKFVQTLPQGSMVGIKRAQTHPINWTLNARVLLWLKRVWVKITFQYLLKRMLVHRAVNACKCISLRPEHKHIDIWCQKISAAISSENHFVQPSFPSS